MAVTVFAASLPLGWVELRLSGFAGKPCVSSPSAVSGWGLSGFHGKPLVCPRQAQVTNFREGLCQQTRVEICHLEKLRASPSERYGKWSEMSRDGRRREGVWRLEI